MDVALTDITAAAFATLTNPPDGLVMPAHPSGLCLLDKPACLKGTAVPFRLDDLKHYERNKDWDPLPLPDIRRPISWPFLKPPTFRKSSKGQDILNLSFVNKPPAGYRVKIFRVRYGTGAILPPAVIAVAYPLDIDIGAPPKFLVHFKHIPGQAKQGEEGFNLFRFFDPEGYDWLSNEIWNWLVFNVFPDAVRPGDWKVDMPFLAPQPRSFGFAYQLRQSRQYVLVLPQIIREFDPATKQLKKYQLHSAETLRSVLLAIQKELFKGVVSFDEGQLGHVAISTNSSGCGVVSHFLSSNLLRLDNANIREFMVNELNELFVLDPPEAKAGSAIVAPAIRWRSLRSTRSSSKGKCLRFYSHSFLKEFAGLSGPSSSFIEGTSANWESPDKRTSLTYLPIDKRGDIWQRTLQEFIPGSRLAVSNFEFVHHVIFALCLTDAASKSLYW
ncbi:hypothetical protein ACFXNW_06530 [Nocardia sp. NPDC059180]|uniref:hypothetical protein n=1 Tax=Nocardia sp. NPDC059180 TaxID=3346761 RepID=UPI0036CEB22C